MKQPNKNKIFEMSVFAMLGAIMFVSKLLMEALPNIHLLGLLVMAYTLVYRVKALIPIYIFVLLLGVYAGFNLWWLPHLYLWIILFLITLFLPRKIPPKLKYVIYPLICSLFGLCYGTLYAPAQALMFGLNFEGMIAWIISGIPFDIIHAISNFFVGLMIVPLSELLKKLHKASV